LVLSFCPEGKESTAESGLSASFTSTSCSFKSTEKSIENELHNHATN